MADDSTIFAQGQELDGRTVVVLGGSYGIGLEAARRARNLGATIVLTARDPDRLRAAANDVGAEQTSAFDTGDPGALNAFFAGLEGPIDHVLVTGSAPVYGPVLENSRDEFATAISKHPLLVVDVVRSARNKMRPGGTFIFMGGTGARRISSGAGVLSVIGKSMKALIAVLATELAPLRINLIAAGFVDTPLSASLLGEGLNARRADLRNRLPIGRVVTAEDVGALAVHIMTNTALTGAVYDVDGGEQFIP